MDPVGEFALMILGPSAGRRTSLVSHVETLGPKDPDRLHTLTYCAPSWLVYAEGSETETGASVAETTVLFLNRRVLQPLLVSTIEVLHSDCKQDTIAATQL